MRLAMSHGMHTSMPVSELGLHIVERCRKIWWTIDILNRQMTCVQGLPQSIDDNFVQTSLPSFAESPLRALTLDMHIKLSRSVSEINKSEMLYTLSYDIFSTIDSGLCHRWTNKPEISVEYQRGIDKPGWYCRRTPEQIPTVSR